MDFGSNLSDHSPLACSLQVDLSVTPPSSAPTQSTKTRIAWHAADSDLIRSYCDLVSHYLPNSICDCCDPQCMVHTPVLDWFCEQLSLCLHHCAVSTMPTVRHSSSVPGWNTAARLYEEKANFWHAVWKQAGSPSSGVLHQIKKSSRSRYKYEVRRLRRHEEFIRREKMAPALASSNSKRFWQQVHCGNKSNKPFPASSVDGVSGSSHISQLFSSKLERLLNSQPSTGCDSLHPSLLSSLSADDLKAVSISEECVVGAFSHLKRGKSDGSTLMSDHLIHTSHLLIISFFVHCHS